MTPTEIYILYGFLAFICLLLVTLVTAVLRLSFVIGKMQGQLEGMNKLLVSLANQINEVTERVGSLERQVSRLTDRIGSLMRHHHNDAGQVVIVPAEEVAAADN
ncbi:MAG: hypothetical protein F4X64_19240 [Chloroflexi bacterium]|nr:hypothetical protein [Chloroflexota bacterium]